MLITDKSQLNEMLNR